VPFSSLNLIATHLRRTYCLLPVLLLIGFAGCKHAKLETHEYMYVSAAETSLRDRVATLYGKVGTVRNGDRVEILEKQRRFIRVRTGSGQEGWIEQRSLVPQDVYDGFQQLAKDNANVPVQAHGTTRAELNMHLTPARDGERLYQLKEGEKLEILKRATTDKNAPKTPVPAKATETNATSAAAKNKPPAESVSGSKKSGNKSGLKPAVPSKAAPESQPNSESAAEPPPPPKPVMEDWFLVRDPGGRVGWVLLRMVDLDVPLDVAQYAEGQRITGYFVLNTVDETTDDGTKAIPQYLVLLNEPKDGLPWDYNQIRVFTRNRARHRYETAYRERNMEGYLPVKVGHQVFDKEGDLPTFTIRKMNDAGQIVETTYKLNGPIVRRVPTPEEEAAEKAKRESDQAARKQAAEQARAKRAVAPKKQSSSHKKKHH
jgi:SH3-like domain-containing protein